MHNLPPVVAYLCLHLEYPFLQGHGGLHLKEADLRLQSGDLRFSGGSTEHARRNLHAHGVEEDQDVLDVSPHRRPAA
jgi:hypothetical protein